MKEQGNMQAVQSSLISYSNDKQSPLFESGLQQSLSGSETDVSTSTENLTAEEKNVLHNSIRQEPQGEETLVDDLDTSSSNTLIIRNNSSIDGFTSPFYGKSNYCFSNGSNIFSIQDIGPPPLVDKSSCIQKVVNEMQKMQKNGCSSKGDMDSIPPSPQIGSKRIHFSSSPKSDIQQALNGLGHSGSSSTRLGSNALLHRDHSVQEITEIPKHYLDQSEVLKHLAKEVHHQQIPYDLAQLPPPPEYPKWKAMEEQKLRDEELLTSLRSGGIGRVPGMYRSAEEKASANRLSISRSHPDLSHLDIGGKYDSDGYRDVPLNQRPKTRGRAAIEVDSESASQAAQMIELLTNENAALKSELDMYYRKVSKLQMFELEIQKVHQAHEELVRSTDKREKLERAVRFRLEMEVRRLQESNKELKEHLDAAMSQLSKRPMLEVADSEIKKEISKRDVLLAQLLSQNKELLAEKERQEIELQAQRVTLQEQRNHIDILDSALTNAQTNVVKLEEENRKKQVYVERVAQLQKALANLQVASDRRLQMEKKLRDQQEKEIEALRAQKEGKSSSRGKLDSSKDVEEMKRTIREYEEKIISLEAEVAKWEQCYLEESTMRQIAVDAASVPKDAKIAALERTSLESEKLIAQARTEKLKHMDDLYAAQRKCAELEGRIKDLESKLAEKDAMIKVLQQHSQEKDAVLQSAVLGRPPRHTRAASTVGLSTSTTASTTTVDSSLCLGSQSTGTLHHRVGSKDELGATCSKSVVSTCSTDSLNTTPSTTIIAPTESLMTPKMNLNEQLKDLDTRLSSKDSIIHALQAEKEQFPTHFWRV